MVDLRTYDAVCVIGSQETERYIIQFIVFTCSFSRSTVDHVPIASNHAHTFCLFIATRSHSFSNHMHALYSFFSCYFAFLHISHSAHFVQNACTWTHTSNFIKHDVTNSFQSSLIDAHISPKWTASPVTPNQDYESSRWLIHSIRSFSNRISEPCFPSNYKFPKSTKSSRSCDAFRPVPIPTNT